MCKLKFRLLLRLDDRNRYMREFKFTLIENQMAIELIATLISICKSAIVAGRGLKSLADEQLTEREEEILREGAANGLFQITKIECVPDLLCNSTGRMFGRVDPAIAAHYLEAFRKLCHRGYVVPCDGELFQLSGTGFDTARELPAKIGT